MVEDLSIQLRGGKDKMYFSSEIWVRYEGKFYLAVRIDWMGHPTRPKYSSGSTAHYHLEKFLENQFANYIHGPKGVRVEKFDPHTGLPTKSEAHGEFVLYVPR
jgi:hypothetical protein